MSIHQFVRDRPFGLPASQSRVQKSAMYRNYSPLTMRELPVSITDSNKIFAAKWISHDEIAFGTKCNQLKILNVSTLKQFSIPLLRRQQTLNGDALRETPSNCGIHTIAVNPSESRVATGGENPNDIAVYSLPQIDPLMLGEKGHKDWVFCSSWLDDEFLATGSRDNYLCLWHIPPEDTRPSFGDDDPMGLQQGQGHAAQSGSNYGVSDGFEVPFHSVMQPVAKKLCQTSDRVRAMAFNSQREELAVTSLNGYIHTWDVGLMKQLKSEKLVDCQETVTLCYSAEHNLYCCGSYHYLMFFDPRTMRLAQCYALRDKETGIRSLATVDNVLTIGTGKGLIRFYDLAANRFITCNCGVDWSLKAGNGRITENGSTISELLNIPPSDYKHAIYSLAYDRSHSRLFAAGGPLHAQISGNYAALWM